MSHPENFFENNKKSNTIRISLNPIDWHEGLRKQIENAEKEFLELPHMKNALHDIVERMSNRYCDVCFFGRPKVVAYADNLCEECANNMYELDKDNTGPFPVLKRKKSYGWWVMDMRRRVNEALFAAYYELAQYKVKEEEDGK